MKRKTLISILSVALALACVAFALIRDGQQDVSFEYTLSYREPVLDEAGHIVALLATDAATGEEVAVDVRGCEKAVTPSGRVGFSHLSPGDTLYVSEDPARSVPDAAPPVIAAEVVVVG